MESRGPATTEDSVDMALAVLVAAVPLIPYGPRYLGLTDTSVVEFAFLALLAIWGVERHRQRGGNVSAGWATRVVTLSWAALVVVLTAATWRGLIVDNDLASPVFWAHARDAGARLFRPLNMVTYPLYPLRVGLTWLEGFLVFVAVCDLCRRANQPARRCRRIVTGLLAGLALVSVGALVQYAFALGLHPYWVEFQPDVVRAHSTLDDPNALGSYLVLAIGLAAGVFLGTRRARRRRLVGVLVVLALVALWTTGSRAALGGLLLATALTIGFLPGVVVSLREARRERWARIAGRLCLAAVALAVLGSLAVRLGGVYEVTGPADRPEGLVESLDPRIPARTVVTGRLTWWAGAAQMIREYPLAGIGLGRYPRLIRDYGPRTILRDNTHNLYLQLAAEAGLPGVVAFVALLGTSLLVLYRTARSRAGALARSAAGGLWIGLIALGITLLTGHALLLPSIQGLWAITLATVLVRGEHEAARAMDTPAVGRPIGPASTPVAHLGAGGVAAVAVGITLGLVALYSVGTRALRVPLSTPPWGYSWNLYPPETGGDGRTFRWTRGEALLQIRVPAGASGIVLPLVVPRPAPAGPATEVRVSSGVETHAFEARAGAESVRVTIPRSRRGIAEEVLIRIEVTPTFVPAEAVGSTDHRELGVQIFRPSLQLREAEGSGGSAGRDGFPHEPQLHAGVARREAQERS